MGGQLWAKFALNLIDNPKIIVLSDTAFRAFIEAIMYSRQHLTDGFLDARIVAVKWAQAVDELTGNDPRHPSWIPVEGGFSIHNYSEYQMTNDDIERKRAAQSRNGRRSAEARRTKVNQDSTNGEPTSNQIQPELELETELEKSSVSKPKRKTELKLDWKPSPAGYEYARVKAPGMNVDVQVEKFLNYNQHANRLSADWDAAWRTWVIKAVEFDPSLAIPIAPPKRQFTDLGDEDV